MGKYIGIDYGGHTKNLSLRIPGTELERLAAETRPMKLKILIEIQDHKARKPIEG